MAERVGFEPTVPLLGGTRDFQSRSFGQLGHLSAMKSAEADFIKRPSGASSSREPGKDSNPMISNSIT